jgi:hypothetical protein
MLQNHWGLFRDSFRASHCDTKPCNRCKKLGEYKDGIYLGVSLSGTLFLFLLLLIVESRSAVVPPAGVCVAAAPSTSEDLTTGAGVGVGGRTGEGARLLERGVSTVPCMGVGVGGSSAEGTRLSPRSVLTVPWVGVGVGVGGSTGGGAPPLISLSMVARMPDLVN